MIVVKIHTSRSGKIVALCDYELLGKKYEENGFILDLTSNFYRGEIKSEKEILDLLKGAHIINAVGAESVALLLDKQYIEKDRIIKIKGVLHAQCVSLVNEI